MSPERLVFLDETWAKTNMARCYGRARRGQRVVASVLHGHVSTPPSVQGESSDSRVAFEPTGAYHHAFERRLAEAGLPLVKVNPRQARRFAEAIGRHAKTDAVDAAMLARFAALLEPPARPVVSATLDAMPGSAKELQVARRALIKYRVAACNRAAKHRSALLKRQARQRLRQIDRQIIAIDAALHAELAADPALQAPLRDPGEHPRRRPGHHVRHLDRDARARHPRPH